MNLNQLFKIQKDLDKKIVKEKGLQEQDLLDKKILALQVELGELANEWKGFKFWSEDRSPRDYDIPCHACNGLGYFMIEEDEDDEEDCGYCDSTGVQENNSLLTEYVDCLHFILSIGLELRIPDIWDCTAIMKTQCRDITSQFISFNEYLHPEINAHDWFEVMELLLGLGDMLRFTWEEIEYAYYEKNKINHERQKNGY